MMYSLHIINDVKFATLALSLASFTAYVKTLILLASVVYTLIHVYTCS